jgi:hypothetical protein
MLGSVNTAVSHKKCCTVQYQLWISTDCGSVPTVAGRCLPSSTCCRLMALLMPSPALQTGKEPVTVAALPLMDRWHSSYPPWVPILTSQPTKSLPRWALKWPSIILNKLTTAAMRQTASNAWRSYQHSTTLNDKVLAKMRTQMAINYTQQADNCRNETHCKYRMEKLPTFHNLEEGGTYVGAKLTTCYWGNMKHGGHLSQILGNYSRK